MKNRAAVYIRLSVEDRNKKSASEESESIINQRNMLCEYCQKQGWEIVGIYCDEDLSGADSTRPEFLRMLEDCEKGLADIVLCKSQSRFSRDIETVEKYIHGKFAEWGVRFVGLVDHADTDDLANKKARQINGLINEWYLEEVSENIRRTLKHKRERGEFVGAFAPYGYRTAEGNKNRLETDYEAAEVVREIFRLFASGESYRRIAESLNSKGIPSPSEYKRLHGSRYRNVRAEQSRKSGKWTEATIYRIVRNECYRGVLVQGRTRGISHKSKRRVAVSVSEQARCENVHDEIIDARLWGAVQERLSAGKHRNRISE